MRYCKKCLYPDTKPDLFFDENGVCSACNAYANRRNINWEDREKQFIELANKTKITASARCAEFDCIVPVSGGKDSHYQVFMAQKYGLKVLAVNAKTCSLSDLGRANLHNISRFADLISISTDITVRRNLNKYALETIGDISWPEHVTIFTVPFIIAEQMNIPLIIWGENPQNEYGGPENSQKIETLNGEEWLSEFGGLNGLRVDDVIDAGILPENKSFWYRYPPCVDDINSVFLGSYFPWDGYMNYVDAYSEGFKVYKGGVEGIGFAYENLDNYQTGLRDYLKYVKFGFGRATDLVCNHIRRGRLSREEGISHINKWEGQWPATYLGKSLEAILSEVNVTVDEYYNTVNKYANKNLFDVNNSEFYRINPKFTVGTDYNEGNN